MPRFFSANAFTYFHHLGIFGSLIAIPDYGI